MKNNIFYFIRAKFIILAFLLPLITNGQQRYYDEIFTNTEVISSVQYGSNYSIETGTPTLTNLLMDVYTPPSSDTVTLRPLIIILHTGRFLPVALNNRCTGTRTDSAVVELCTRFAKRGYVAAAVSYRLGWNPLSLDQDTRSGTFINAVYRGIQDAKNAVRYFRNNALNEGNTYGIDQDNIILGGQGDGGGYIALGYWALDDPNELFLDKFRSLFNTEPYIDTTQIGDYNGLQGLAPYNNINVPNVANNVKMVFNIGGAIPDSSWIQGEERPIVSFHSTQDPFTPYSFGALIEPTTGDFVMEISGSYDVVRKANILGTQNIWDGLPGDVYSARANSVNNGYEGLFPFIITPDIQAEPWEWWSAGCSNNANALLSNPDMSSSKGKTYIDTIIGYLNPRIILAFQYTTCQAGFNLFPDSLVEHNWFATNTSTGSAPFTYIWYWGDGDSTVGSNPSHVYSSPGYYNICVSITAANFCTDYYCDSSTYIYKTDAEMISVIVIDGLQISIDEKENSFFTLYPNPATTTLTLTNDNQSPITDYQLQIHNTLGQAVMQTTLTPAKLQTLNIEHLSPGIYYLTLSNAEHTLSKKFVKQ